MQKHLLIFVFIISMIEMANGQAIRYVTPNGAGAKTGSSWSDAYANTQLQTAINETAVSQVWVAAGTYKPTTEADRTISFSLKNGVAVYGGFSGTETSLSERDWTTNVTILSGDIGNTDDNSDNSYHVFYHNASSALTSTAILDGFTIQGGKAIDYGGGIYNESSSPMLINLIITGNFAQYGGGIYNQYASPTCINCNLTGNSASNEGGGLYNYYLSSPVLTNCLIKNNSVTNFGAGISNASSSSPIFTNCLIVNNSGAIYGGGLYNAGSSPTLNNCTIAGNSVRTGGGGVGNFNSSPILNNSIIWDNWSLTGGNQFYIQNGTTTLNYCCYSNGTGDIYNAGAFTPTNSITSNPLFINPNNDFRLAITSPCLDAGSNSYNSELTDIRGSGFGRKLSKTDASAGTIDMGAYEFKKGTDPEIPEVLRTYVNANATGLNNGKTWADAYTSLQTALTATGRYYEIWVAAGTYKPTTPNGDRSISFQMKKDVAIYGGFSGTETSLSQRNWATNVTILSGDLNDNDVVTGSGATLTIIGNAENSYHVFYHTASLALTSSAILDGFTIQGGNANDYGGGIYNYDHASPLLSNCIIKRNFANYGGGVCNNVYSSPTISNCTVTENFGYYYGGGVCNFSYSSPVIKNCELSGNFTNSFGGGISNQSNSSPTLTNCLIVNNSTSLGGGIYNDSSLPTLTNCTISGNSAIINGGGVYNYQNSSLVFNNSIIWGNMAATDGNQIYNSNSTVSLNNSCYDNRSGDLFNGAGSTFTPADCTMADPKFINPNTDFRLAITSPCLDTGNNSYNNETTDNRGTGFGRKLLKTDASQSGTIDMGAYEFKKGTDPEIPELLKIYVKADASGSDDGTSWVNAFKSLQSALSAAKRYYEIWVAAGTYKPTTGTDRSISFRMKNDLAIYGGFKGTETSLNERNWITNVTILSGDLNGNDMVTGNGMTLVFTGNTENSLHVVFNSKLVYGNAILDGFTIKGGNANDGTFGGGIYNGEYSSPLLANCTISENFANYYGGGIANYSYSSPTITNCTISRNTSNTYGGGIYNLLSSPILTNCLIANNYSSSYGGGIWIESSSPILTNCTISGNYASRGGGIGNNTGKPTINNSIIWGNTAKYDGSKQMYNYNTSVITLNYSCYANGTDDNYDHSSVSFTPDANCINTAPKFVDLIKDFRIVDTSPCVDAGLNSYNTQATDIRGFQFGRKLLKTNASLPGPIDIGAYEFNRGYDPGNPTNGGTIDDVEAVCGAGSTPPQIKSTSLPSGHVGTLEYKWQLSTTSTLSGFADIASSNSETYSPEALTTATWFKRLSRIDLMTDWVGAAESNVLQIKIDPVTIGGSVSGSDIVCAGINSTPLTLSGQTGSVIKWQSSIDDWATFTDITNATTTLTATNLTATTKYRAVVQSGVCTVENSADAMVTVDPLPVPSIVGIESACVGTNGVTYTTETGMTGYTWIISDGGTITSGTSTNAITVTWNTAGAQTVSVNYMNSNSCSAATATVKNVTVNPLPQITSAEVTPSSIVGSGHVQFSATASSGTIKWYNAPTGGSIITDLNPSISSTTTYYAEATSDAGCISFPRTAATATVIPVGTTQISYRLTNPRIVNASGTDYFEFEVQVKANASGTIFKTGNINLEFDNSTLSTNATNWMATPISDYTTVLSIVGSTLNIGINFVTYGFAIKTDYLTLMTIRGQITNKTGMAGINFNEANMNGKQFYKLDVSPGDVAYANPNLYDAINFMDIYVGRIYAERNASTPIVALKTKEAKIYSPWSQVASLNWAAAENTSIWYGNATISGGSLSLASNLRIHESAKLTIPMNGELTVNGNTEIRPDLGLVIESDATGTGSLITGTSSGSAVVQRYMTTDAWHIIASPVSGQSIASFLTSNDNVAQEIDNNSIRGMMDYNPEINNWNAYFTNSTAGKLETGKGFCIRNNANGAVNFTGSLNAGNQTTSGLISEKWNCTGNPYTSAIGINNGSSSNNNFLTENSENLDPSFGAIYVWNRSDSFNGKLGEYTIISNTITDAPFDVQQGQAYMLKMTAGKTAVTFNAGMQMHETGLELKSTKKIWPNIKLEATVSSIKSSTTIAFSDRMTKGLDPTYDAGLLKGSSDLVIYSRLVEDNGVPFAIQALPANDSGMIIPIGIDFKTGGEVTFSAELIDLPLSCQVILEDKQTKTFTDLSQNNYKTTIAANSVITDRFQIHTSNLTTGMNATDLAGKLTAFAIRNIEIRVKGQVSNQAIATLYDIQGRVILIKNMEEGSLNIIKTPNIRTGIYMLSVKDNGKINGFKIPVKE